MRRRWIVAICTLLCLAALASRGAVAGQPASREEWLARHVVEKAGIRRGVCAVLGNYRIAPLMARSTELLVHAIDPITKARSLRLARIRLAREGLYGARLIVEQGKLDRLPYADNLLDIVYTYWLDTRLKGLTAKEILRVLRPGGAAILHVAPTLPAPGPGETMPSLIDTDRLLRQWLGGVKATTYHNTMGDWATIVKPTPKGVDDWSHWQHGPDNNPFSSDRVIRAPYMTQFLALPWFSTMPSISVIAGGRMFRAAGHMAIHEREEQYLNTLYATNAYNGAMLWTRKIPENFLAHRSIFVATPDVLYLLEPTRCLLLDPETGKEKGTIRVPKDVAPDPRWRWLALHDGALYALLGGKEDFEAEIIKRKRPHGAWGWNELSKGYYTKKYEWGYGSTVVALDAETHRVRWSHREPAPVDSRAICLGHGKVFLHSEGVALAALDEKTGRLLWRTTDPHLLKAIAAPFSAGLGFKTTPYAICTPEAVYFGGRGRRNVVGVSAADGKLLWVRTGAYNATNLLYQKGHLYAHVRSCHMLDANTGAIVRELGIAKRSCARLTGCPEALFHRGSIRGGEGTTRYDFSTGDPTVIHAFRPPCNDGIIPAAGLLHITQWDCDCNLQLMGGIAVCSVGDFPINAPATDAKCLQTLGEATAELRAAPDDWPTYRADPQRSSSTRAAVPAAVTRTWAGRLGKGLAPSPPTAAGGLVFLADDDGIVHALDAATGKARWTAHTAGPVRIPPSIAGRLAYVGSADGHVYALEAATGRLVWRFRVAPVDRRIMVFGKLCSTWPVHSGALVHDGTVYAAGGLINYDGTHVVALDAATGRLKWQNSTSGHLNTKLREGVSAQGDLALCGDTLLLAGGNVASPGVYRLDGGKCLTPPPGPGWPGASSGSLVCGFLGKYPMVGGGRRDGFVTLRPACFAFCSSTASVSRRV